NTHFVEYKREKFKKFYVGAKNSFDFSWAVKRIDKKKGLINLNNLEKHKCTFKKKRINIVIMATQNNSKIGNEEFLEDILIVCPKCKTNNIHYYRN
ncbi:hypothetical protein LCGC14_2131380, partial [marine sediment metagenome]